MSLEKAIKYRKEKRKEYRGSKAFDRTCRNHGSCGWCESNRTFSEKKKRFSIDEQLDEYFDEDDS